jgi:hypothetical protein
VETRDILFSGVCRRADLGCGLVLSGRGESGAIRKSSSLSVPSDVVSGESSPTCRFDRIEEVDVVEPLAALLSGVAGRNTGMTRLLRNEGVRGRFDVTEASSLLAPISGSGTEPICGVVGRESSPFRKDLRPIRMVVKGRY